jgi:hypothetical protein
VRPSPVPAIFAYTHKGPEATERSRLITEEERGMLHSWIRTLVVVPLALLVGCRGDGAGSGGGGGTGGVGTATASAPPGLFSDHLARSRPKHRNRQGTSHLSLPNIE